jgi:dihydroflavonol-4-reductase
MILVTGATGHIGNVLVRELLARGEKVRALVRPGKPPIPLAGLEVEIVPGDILDPVSLIQAMQGVDLVYHLAARISLLPGPDPEVERVNLEGTRNVLAAMRQGGVRRLVYASSIYAMRIPSTGPVDERLPFDPQSARGAYDQSKAAATLEVLQAAAAGLQAVVVCPTAVVGPYDFQNSDAGRGIRYNMQAGIKAYVDGAYDFVDVRDVADGFIQAAALGRPGATYILGGNRLTVRQVAEIVWQAAGSRGTGIKIPLWLAYLTAELMPLFYQLTGRLPIFTRYSLDALGSNSNIRHARAAQELGYHPRPAQQAILDAVGWFQIQARSAQAVSGLEQTESIFKATA